MNEFIQLLKEAVALSAEVREQLPTAFPEEQNVALRMRSVEIQLTAAADILETELDGVIATEPNPQYLTAMRDWLRLTKKKWTAGPVPRLQETAGICAKCGSSICSCVPRHLYH